jgi:hypothetical protein
MKPPADAELDGRPGDTPTQRGEYTWHGLADVAARPRRVRSGGAVQRPQVRVNHADASLPRSERDVLKSLPSVMSKVNNIVEDCEVAQHAQA